MRSLTSVASVVLSAVGIAIALVGPAAAFPAIQTPEPMSALVFGAGLVGAAIVARRNKK